MVIGDDSDLLNPKTKEEDLLAEFSTPIPQRLHPMDLDQKEFFSDDKKTYDRQQYFIRLANTPERREKAALLIDRMYAREGYQHEHILHKTPHTITLNIYRRDGNVAGTITIGIDSPENGLLAEGEYHNEINNLRSKGRKICEFNGLAIDPEIRSKIFVARLFHIAMIYPWGLFKHKDLVIEVNPSHSRFYMKMLGFQQIGEERVCQRVNAKSVLLYLSLDWAAERIDKVGGLGELALDDKTLYPYFFGKVDAAGILGRLQRMDCK